MHMVVVRPSGQFEVVRRLAPGGGCHCPAVSGGPRLPGHRLRRMSVSDCEDADKRRWGSGGPRKIVMKSIPKLI
jgi:hypothetical protein